VPRARHSINKPLDICGETHFFLERGRFWLIAEQHRPSNYGALPPQFHLGNKSIFFS
jgi:hypothetical protein